MAKNMSNEERILWLKTFIDKEMEKPIAGIDSNKVSQWVDELLTLQGQNISLTQEEISRRLATISFVRTESYLT